MNLSDLDVYREQTRYFQRDSAIVLADQLEALPVFDPVTRTTAHATARHSANRRVCRFASDFANLACAIVEAQKS
jgi:hypothetical protein